MWNAFINLLRFCDFLICGREDLVAESTVPQQMQQIIYRSEPYRVRLKTCTDHVERVQLLEHLEAYWTDFVRLHRYCLRSAAASELRRVIFDGEEHSPIVREINLRDRQYRVTRSR